MEIHQKTKFKPCGLTSACRKTILCQVQKVVLNLLREKSNGKTSNLREKPKENATKQAFPPVYRLFFKIHGSKLKPGPVSDASQAAKICKPHCTFFLGIGKKAFDGFPCGGRKVCEVPACGGNLWQAPGNHLAGALIRFQCGICWRNDCIAKDSLRI